MKFKSGGKSIVTFLTKSNTACPTLYVKKVTFGNK